MVSYIYQEIIKDMNQLFILSNLVVASSEESNPAGII